MADSPSSTGQPSAVEASPRLDPIGQMSLNELMNNYVMEYRRVQRLEDLEEAIRQLQDNLDSGEGIESARAFLRIAAAYRAKYGRTQSSEDIQAFAMLFAEATEALPDDHSDKVDMLWASATNCFQLFEQTKSLEDLSMAKQKLRTILGIVREDESMQSMVLQQFAAAEQAEFDVTKKISTLDELTGYLESSIRLTPKSDPEWLERSKLLASAASIKYEKTEDTEDLKKSIGHWESVLTVIPEGDPYKLRTLGALGGWYLSLYDKTKDGADLEKSIDLYEVLLNAYSESHPNRHFALYEQGKAYIAKSNLTGIVAFLEVGARQLKHSLASIPRDSPLRKSLLPYAAARWHDLYKATKGTESLETSMTLLEEVLDLLPSIFQVRRGMLLRLSDLAFDKCMKTEKAEDIAASASRLKYLLSKMPKDDPDWGRLQDQVLNVVVTEYRVLGAPPEAPSKDPSMALYSRSGLGIVPSGAIDDRATRLLREVVGVEKEAEDTPATETRMQKSEDALDKPLRDDPLQALELIQSGMRYNDLFRKSQSMDHMDQAVMSFYQALEIGSTDKTLHSMCLAGLSVALWLKYDMTKADGDHDAAIEATERHLETGDNKLPNLRLLGSQLQRRYLSHGNEMDLDRSLHMYQQTLILTPDHDKRERASALYGVGVCFHLRSRRRAALSDFLAALDHFEQAVEACSTDDPDRSTYLGGLGLGLIFRSARDSDRKSADLGIQRLSQSVDASEDNTEQRASTYVNLARGYINRFHMTDAPSDLDLGISYFQKAMNLRMLHSKEMTPVVLGDLADAYFRRYIQDQDIQTWERGIECSQEAASIGPGNDLDDARRLYNLGKGYKLRYTKTAQGEFLQKAISPLETLLSRPNAAPMLRLLAGKELFEIYTLLTDWNQAYHAATTMFSFVPLAVSRSLENSDKPWLLAELAGLASDAAAVALMAGAAPFDALRLLESSRGVMMGSILGLRSDVDDLQQHHPKVAVEYLKFRDQIDSSKVKPSNPSAAWLPINQPDYRHNANKEMERVIEHIRSLPGFQSFLREPTESEARAAAASATIVVINISQFRCDAIIVKPEGVSLRDLPDVSLRDIKARSQGITSIGLLDSHLLEWLWDKVTGPVLDSLRFTALPDGADWPQQICWIPTGPLVALPLHAAGYHDLAENKTVLDRAISSYSVSITALVQLHAYRQKPEVDRKPERAVLIGMTELAKAPEEVQEVSRICQSLKVVMPEPHSKDVREALKDCDVFHFAGHGSSSPLDPLNSALILEKPDRLTVSSLFDMNLHRRRPFLAFLSACSTGQIKHDGSMDEGLHLIAACQVAGFQNVIGTLWEVNDELCVEAARLTYSWMQKEGMSHKSVKVGLHRACRQLRDAWVHMDEERRARNGRARDAGAKGDLRKVGDAEELPMLWVPYVHYGI